MNTKTLLSLFETYYNKRTIEESNISKCINNKLLVGSFYKSIYLRKKCKEYNISLIITTMLMEYLPFLPFILNKKIEFRGIIYRT